MTAAVPPANTPLFHPNLPLSVIVESIHNPRKRFDEASLQELAETIRARGIHNPVLVREVESAAGTRFELAAGHRRCRAARLVGLVDVPALIMQLDDDAFFELLHLDNLQRDDVDPLDEALGYEALLARGYDVGAIAHKIGKSITYVATRVRLLSLGTAAREAMRLGYVKVSHAIELAKLPEATQEQLLRDYWNLSPEALLKSAGVTLGDEADAEDDTDDADDDVDEEDPEYFAAPPADTTFRDRHWRDIKEPTLQDLKRAMALDVYRKLSVVPWDLSDETLVPEVGACTRCPKRSSMEPLLFEELNGADDACLDSECYDAKRTVFYDLQRGVARGDRKTGDHAEADHEAERAERIRVQKEQAQKDVERREKQQQELRIAQSARAAAVRAVLAAVPNRALGQLAWLQILFVAVIDRLSGLALDQMLQLMELDTMPPADARSYDHAWKRARLEEWAKAPERSVRPLTRALVLAAIGQETVYMGTEVDDHLTTLPSIAALAGVDLETVAREAEQQAKADTKKARRRAKAVAA